MTLRDPFTIDGFPARWVWGTTDDPFAEDPQPAGSIPAGLVIDHPGHRVLITWIPVHPADDQVFTLLSLDPLTLVEPLRCALCEWCGRIEQGAWVPVEVPHG